VTLLAGKRVVVTGVVTRDSIAYAIAERALDQGAEVVLTSFGRARRLTERAAGRLPREVDVLELDVNEPSNYPELEAELRSRWGAVDGVLHAIAFAPPDALGGNFMSTPDESALMAFRTSAVSLRSLSGSLADLLAADGGGAVVGLDFDASVAWPVYDWMGVAKAGLEAVSRYTARDLGPRGIRVNLISAGPLRTVAAGGIPGFEELATLWETGAPLGWDDRDPSPVADAACFLLSDYGRGVTGEILHVDGGFHAMGAPVTAGSASAADRPDQDQVTTAAGPPAT
jgi:meromycolic acid enoyl-[acyl-carrier protein] reductase